MVKISWKLWIFQLQLSYWLLHYQPMRLKIRKFLFHILLYFHRLRINFVHFYYPKHYKDLRFRSRFLWRQRCSDLKIKICMRFIAYQKLCAVWTTLPGSSKIEYQTVYTYCTPRHLAGLPETFRVQDQLFWSHEFSAKILVFTKMWHQSCTTNISKEWAYIVNWLFSIVNFATVWYRDHKRW